jgi:hypothetical protein
VVKFIWSKKVGTVLRCFREFQRLYKDMIKRYPLAVCPMFPSKKSSSSRLSVKEVNQRVKQFDEILKF